MTTAPGRRPPGTWRARGRWSTPSRPAAGRPRGVGGCPRRAGRPGVAAVTTSCSASPGVVRTVVRTSGYRSPRPAIASESASSSCCDLLGQVADHRRRRPGPSAGPSRSARRGAAVRAGWPGGTRTPAPGSRPPSRRPRPPRRRAPVRGCRDGARPPGTWRGGRRRRPPIPADGSRTGHAHASRARPGARPSPRPAAAFAAWVTSSCCSTSTSGATRCTISCAWVSSASLCSRRDVKVPGWTTAAWSLRPAGTGMTARTRRTDRPSRAACSAAHRTACPARADSSTPTMMLWLRRVFMSISSRGRRWSRLSPASAQQSVRGRAEGERLAGPWSRGPPALVL